MNFLSGTLFIVNWSKYRMQYFNSEPFECYYHVDVVNIILPSLMYMFFFSVLPIFTNVIIIGEKILTFC